MQTATESNFELALTDYLPKIRTWGRKSYRSLPGYDLDDFVNEMTEVLWTCVKRYNPNNGAKFNTFFWNCAKNRLVSLQRHYAAKKRAAEVVFLDPETFAHVVDEYKNVVGSYHYEDSPEEWIVAYETAREYRYVA